MVQHSPSFTPKFRQVQAQVRSWFGVPPHRQASRQTHSKAHGATLIQLKGIALTFGGTPLLTGAELQRGAMRLAMRLTGAVDGAARRTKIELGPELA